MLTRKSRPRLEKFSIRCVKGLLQQYPPKAIMKTGFVGWFAWIERNLTRRRDCHLPDLYSDVEGCKRRNNCVRRQSDFAKSAGKTETVEQSECKGHPPT